MSALAARFAERPRTIGLVYGHPFDLGGAEAHVLSLMSRADPTRWRWRVLAATSEPFAARAAAAGAAIEPWIPRHALDRKALFALVEAGRRAPLDLLHVHDARALVLARMAGTRLGLPVVYTVHLPVAGGNGNGSGPRSHLYGAAERLILRLAPPERVVHVSARALARSRGADDGRCVLIPNGIDLARRASPGARERLRAGMGVPSSVCVVTSVARLAAQKGLDVLLAALADVPADDIRVWLAGEGPERPALEACAARLGLAARVSFLGRRDDVPDLLDATDVFVLPSRRETSPIALLEAMAAGRACVATDVGDCGTMLDGGRAGRVVAPGDARGLAAALGELATDGALRARLGEAARHRARLFSDTAMAARTTALYDSLLTR
ncbi:MAG: hypothetical protein DMF78_17565 [Acidobacteria bacterium]|nr:MAG: hypothetical protein DMF78_17565 [Acidobacteriota bacterium]